MTEDVVFQPVRALAESVRTRRLSPVMLAETFLDRLERLGPRYNAVVTVTRDRALEQARRAEAEIASGRYRGPLHGIPYGAKDLLATSGGILETKKIGDYAMEHGVPMAMHFAGTPISFMANVHCAAATENFLALEHHSVDIPWWEDLVSGTKPLFNRGFVTVPDRPGLGVELVDEVAKQHLLKPDEYFLATPQWDSDRSVDRLWSLDRESGLNAAGRKG